MLPYDEAGAGPAVALGTGPEDVSEASDPLERDPGALARLAVPALVAAGEHDLPDFRDGAERLPEALPRARHEVVAGAGHLAPLETPDAFRALVLELCGSTM